MEPAYRAHDFDVSWNVFPGFADPNYFVAYDLKVHLADQWQNPEAAQIADQAATTLDQDKRKELYAKLQDIFVADVPVIVTQEVPAASLTKANISGWTNQSDRAGDRARRIRRLTECCPSSCDAACKPFRRCSSSRSSSSR